MNRWTSRALHEELAAIYRRYRGVAAPANGLTESLWAKIETTEAEERRARG